MHSFNCESVAQKKNVLLTITVMPESRQTRSNQLFPGGEQHPILTIEPPSPMPEDNSHRSGAKKTSHIFEQQEHPKFPNLTLFWCSCSKTFPKATSATSSSNEGSPSCFECSTEGKPLQRQDSSDRERSSLNESQTILLEAKPLTSAQHEGSLVPPPSEIRDLATKSEETIPKLDKRGESLVPFLLKSGFRWNRLVRIDFIP